MTTIEPAAVIDDDVVDISTASKQPARQLACTICQQRKTKCNKRYPCNNCLKSGVPDQCVPASLVPRRRRFPEKELLDRLRQYQELLRQNNVSFEPLHQPVNHGHQLNTQAGSSGSCHEGSMGDCATGGPAKSELRTIYETKDIDDADDGITRSTAIKELWNQTYHNSSHLFFGLRQSNLDLAALHPMPAHIFRLWQIYLDNIDPLLKVTHTPSLQARIIEVMGDVSTVDQDLEALMFSIYCVAVFSIDDEKCRRFFGSSKNELLNGFQFACQQALLNSAFLRTTNRDCLTALYLLLISFMWSTDAHSLSSMVAIAKRVAERMGIHDEAKNVKSSPFEAEMRRRLWWSLVLFDNRLGQTSETKTAMPSPVWDCKLPSNVADLDLRPDMESAPTSSDMPTEALFIVTRAEFGDFIRKSLPHIQFVQPALRPLMRPVPAIPTTPGGPFDAFEEGIENRHLRRCSEDVPLHYVTVWMLRGLLAKSHLLELKTKDALSIGSRQALAQREAVVYYALRNLEADTKLMSSELVARFRWCVSDYFPMPAYMNIIQELRQTPERADAEKLWAALNDNYEARFVQLKNDNWLIFKVLFGMIVQAWDARDFWLKSQDKPPRQPPRIVRDILAAQKETASGSCRDCGSQRHAAQAGHVFGERGRNDLGLDVADDWNTDAQMDQTSWSDVDLNLMHASAW